jgi:hypothetical protein
VIAAAGCSADPATFLGDSTSTQATQRNSAKASRVAAQRAAAAAKAAAEAETAANPLVRIFGSKAQRDAEAAETRLDELLARGEAPKRAAKAAETAKSEKTATAKATTTARAPKSGEAGTHATVRATMPRAPITRKAAAMRVAPPAPQAERPKPLPAATPIKPDVIVYDVVAGIKTLHRADGTVEEEAFDPATLPDIKAPKGGGTQIRIVNETNPVSTGSTAVEQPRSRAVIKAGPT